MAATIQTAVAGARRTVATAVAAGVELAVDRKFEGSSPKLVGEFPSQPSALSYTDFCCSSERLAAASMASTLSGSY